ncbi:hypothetical protein FE257_012730 [Aspergillus nanangensis]|uniref:Beta-glucuronidase C-terminal domain-containing protein n=1 Tax=Aspergillus nanangensis TaxID=2582783 RepID=A0AAD4CFQ7_ASPNN|nr:hypothetical protein FE257_012730 [Aspergillus nanangensis]
MTIRLLPFAVLASLVAGDGLFISVPGFAPGHASEAVPRDLTSFSIEFSSFPDYAGNKSDPNHFSHALLSNLKDITGVSSKIRVGGTTQDHALFYPDQVEAIKLVFEEPGADQPSTVQYGPAYFSTYQAWEGLEFIHGFNFAFNGTSDREQLQSVAMAACTSMGDGLYLSEVGNEMDFAPGWPNYYRPSNWTMGDYVTEWTSKSNLIAQTIEDNCPGVSTGFVAPSFIWTNYTGREPWSPAEAFRLGLGDNGLVKEIGVHNYMNVDSDTRFGVEGEDLQELLMNHSSVIGSVGPHVELARNLSYLGLPYVLSETNSIAGQGRINTTDVMGDALWVVDFTLWVGANNIKRIHFHQGTGYRYASWQPVTINTTQPTTRPPYYGHIMASRALGNSNDTRIVNLPLPRDTEAAYAIYEKDSLARIAILNMEESTSSATHRAHREYNLRLPKGFCGAKVERLMAAGSDSRTGITFGGISYDYELAGGKPVVVDETSTETHLSIAEDGRLRLTLPASSGALVTLF